MTDNFWKTLLRREKELPQIFMEGPDYAIVADSKFYKGELIIYGHYSKTSEKKKGQWGSDPLSPEIYKFATLKEAKGKLQELTSKIRNLSGIRIMDYNIAREVLKEQQENVKAKKN